MFIKGRASKGRIWCVVRLVDVKLSKIICFGWIYDVMQPPMK